MDDARRGLPGQPIELSGGTHVFIDDYLIERTTALTRTAPPGAPAAAAGPGVGSRHAAHAGAVLPAGVPRSRQPRRAVPHVVRRRLHRLGAPQLRLRRVGRRPHLALPGARHRRDRRGPEPTTSCAAARSACAWSTMPGTPAGPAVDPERRFVLLYTGGDRFSGRLLARRIPLDRRSRQPGVPGHRAPHGGPAERLLGPAAQPLPGHRRLLRPARRRLHRQAAVPPRRLSPPGRPDHQHRPTPLDAVSPDRGRGPGGGGADAGVLRHAAGRPRVALPGAPARAARRPAGRSGRRSARHRLDGALHQPRR